MKQRLVIWCVVCLVACKDNPYKEQEPVEKKVDQIEPVHTVHGVVEVGAPVSGATIAAYRFSGLQQGEKLVETVSSDDGIFSFDIKKSNQGPLLLVATGGAYRDLITDEVTAIKTKQELRSAIDGVVVPEKNNINVWTTLAVARVQAKSGFWDDGVAKLDDDNRIAADFNQVSHFLKGSSGNSINIRRQGLLDPKKEPVQLNDPRAPLHLTQGALSLLANKYQKLSEGNSITTIDLVSALAQDLSDRLLDGRDVHGDKVFVGVKDRINLSSYTLRRELAEGVFRYAQKLKAIGKVSENDLLELMAKGKFLDAIALDTRPEFFPEEEKPTPIDITEPVLRVNFTGQHVHERQFTILAGEVVMEAHLENDSSASKIVLIAPEIPEASKDLTYVPFSTEHKQNAIEIAIACDQREQFEANLQSAAAEKEDAVCACFEARDSSGNIALQLKCFLRARPNGQILAPVDKARLMEENLLGGLYIKAHATSGVPLSTCNWSIYGSAHSMVTDALLLKGEGIMRDTECRVDEHINVNDLANGQYVFALRAEDSAGRALGDNTFVSFQIRRDMVRMPGRIVGPRL